MGDRRFELVGPAQTASQEPFAQFLERAWGVKPEALARAQQISQESGERFELVLTRLGVITERERTQALADYLHLPIALEKDFPQEPILAGELNLKFLRQAQFLPLQDRRDGLAVALVNPLDSYTVDAIRFAVGRPVIAHLAHPADFEAALQRLYGEDKANADQMAVAVSSRADITFVDDIDRLKDLASDAPVIRLVNQLIAGAVERGASDIHIEPMLGELSIRYRLDGVLQKIDAPPVQLGSAIVSRIKVMTKLNIAERRLPQDGRISMAVRGKEIDLRVSTTPTSHGESIVLRILDRQQVELNFAALGFEAELSTNLRELLSQPHGILLVTGPTGSGKTTTLYAALTELNTVEKKILTIEDPVEYHLKGINQVQVKPDIGLTFARALRSFLRQDPDIMMVGEVRDLETAQVAVQAALTGHLILSTLHTNDAASALTRLLDMGVEDYLLTSTISGVVAQRLVRKLCPVCREAFEPLQKLWDQLDLPNDLPHRLYRGKGCPDCNHTGYRGRTAIVEVLPISDAVRHAILESHDARAIQDIAAQQGMRCMRMHGLEKAVTGITSLEEVLRATRAE